MKNDMGKRAWRIALRVKLIAACLALVGIALVIVGAFAAGFAAGALVATSDQRDQCGAAGGTWDGEAKLCMQPRASSQQAASMTEGAPSAYVCGDGTRFTVSQIDATRIRYQDSSTTSRELVNEDPGANMAVYADGGFSLTLVAIEARLRDAATGRDIACELL